MLQVLEGLYTSGKARAIGVSNYNTAHLRELLAAAEVKPMVNQVRTLFDFMTSAGGSLLWHWVRCCRKFARLLEDLQVLHAAGCSCCANLHVMRLKLWPLLHMRTVSTQLCSSLLRPASLAHQMQAGNMLQSALHRCAKHNSLSSAKRNEAVHGAVLQHLGMQCHMNL
jgi:hypothetical protein